MGRTVPVLTLKTLEDTEKAAHLLAEAIKRENPGAVLLYGELGAGKTAFARFLVSALPGGDEAEVASPSFTICNIYCTAPLVHHYDLYRLEGGMINDALAESLETLGVLTIVEWPERMAAGDFPAQAVICRFILSENGESRLLTFEAAGAKAERCLSYAADHAANSGVPAGPGGLFSAE